MPKPRIHKLINCTYFSWKLYRRRGIWYADGRTNAQDLGRHSLGTSQDADARKLLTHLDRKKAEEKGLAPRSSADLTTITLLELDSGRSRYETHLARPVAVGGVQRSTRKRYKATFDKFVPWAKSNGIRTWNDVTGQTLIGYADYLKAGGGRGTGRPYSDKSLLNELTTLKQCIKWLIAEGHLTGSKPIELKVKKVESQRAYCWRPAEVSAIVARCKDEPSLTWMGEVVIALACTGLRIGELVGLKWADVDLEGGMLHLTDESNRAGQGSEIRRRLKTGRGRSFPISPEFLAVLKGRTSRSGYVFYGPRRGRLKADTVRRTLIGRVLEPLKDQFPAAEGQQSFSEGRLHSFRHYFCSRCANEGVPEQMLMLWLGHRDSEMVRHYYHLHDAEARRKMNGICFLGEAPDGPRAAKK